jgi:hypothetical protein
MSFMAVMRYHNNNAPALHNNTFLPHHDMYLVPVLVYNKRDL